MSFVCSNADLMLRVRSSPRTLMPAKKEEKEKKVNFSPVWNAATVVRAM